MMIRGVPVDFGKAPYPAQIAVANAVLSASQQVSGPAINCHEYMCGFVILS